MRYNIFLLFFLICSACYAQKINGVVFVAPAKESGPEGIQQITRVAANYVALNPYAFSGNNKPGVHWNSDGQWWGEKEAGIEQCIIYARQSEFSIMMKPHVWVGGQGWAADYDLPDDASWLQWERDYRTYILKLARLSEKHKVEIFCVGTEYKNAVNKRPAFWKQLIEEVRKVYSGKMTYASNWDNYESIPFWDQLDFIGIDAYFPLVNAATPETVSLVKAWQPVHTKLKTFADRFGKKVLFAEYGYRSIDHCAWNQWELAEQRGDDHLCNVKAQQNAYEALYKVFWNEPWIAGGFIWKWYAFERGQIKGVNTDYTPQSKAVEAIIRAAYSQN